MDLIQSRDLNLIFAKLYLFLLLASHLATTMSISIKPVVINLFKYIKTKSRASITKILTFLIQKSIFNHYYKNQLLEMFNRSNIYNAFDSVIKDMFYAKVKIVSI